MWWTADKREAYKEQRRFRYFSQVIYRSKVSSVLLRDCPHVTTACAVFPTRTSLHATQDAQIAQALA